MTRKEKIERMFTKNSGYFGINFSKITKTEKFEDDDYSIFLYCDNSEEPVLRLIHKSRAAMEAAYESIKAIKNNRKCKIIDFEKFKSNT